LRYTLRQFIADFPNNDVCLDYLFALLNPICNQCHGSAFYRIRGRLGYVCYCGKQVYPLKGTIFEKSRTPLADWFYVIYLFSVSKNGVAATEIQRHLGVTYKTAWRMGHQVRKLMYQHVEVMLDGIVEVDEVFIGGKRRMSCKNKNKVPVFGLLERGGIAKAFVADGVTKTTARDVLNRHVYRGSRLMTDDSRIYHGANILYNHQFTVHSRREYVRDNVHTNSIEGFWGQLQRSLHGTHHSVSKKWMQAYVDEFVFHYNTRGMFPFDELTKRLRNHTRLEIYSPL
jgi:transposase